MKAEELVALEAALCDVVSESFDKMPNAGTSRWDLQKVELINSIISELNNITVDDGGNNEK